MAIVIRKYYNSKKITLELRTRVNVAITDRCVQLLALQQTAAVEVKAEFRFVYFFSRNLIGSFFLFYTQPSIFAQVSAYNVKCCQIGYMRFCFFFCSSLVGNFFVYILGRFWWDVSTRLMKLSSFWNRK